MKIMLRGAVGGEALTDEEIAGIDLSCKGRIGCYRMIPLSVGTIGKIEGLEKIKAHKAVTDVLQYYHEGDTVEQRVIGTLGQHFCRVVFIVDSPEEAVEVAQYIQKELIIYDTQGNRMDNLPFDVKRLEK